MIQEPHTTGPGLVMLSSSCELLHMNRRAQTLLTRLKSSAQTAGSTSAITAPLYPHCQDIIETLQARLAVNNWEQFHQYRVIGDPTDQILLKGFGLPDRRGLPHSRIVMLLTPHSPFSTPTSDSTESPDAICKQDVVDRDSPRATGR